MSGPDLLAETLAYADDLDRWGQLEAARHIRCLITAVRERDARLERAVQDWRADLEQFADVEPGYTTPRLAQFRFDALAPQEADRDR